jgi:hypothetical protein
VDEENEYITPVDVGTDADDKPSDKPTLIPRPT